MMVNFSSLRYNERPLLILKNANGETIGILGFTSNIELQINYNETSTISFDVPAHVDGHDVPFYNSIIGMRIIEIPGIGRFTLSSPTETDDGVKRYKKCNGYSLEYEFAYKNITVENGTYKFWNTLGGKTEDTILGIIMSLMPSWSVGSVDSSLVNKYRTFEVSNENLYNFIKSTIQESYDCIFDFDTINRRVYVRDANNNALSRQVYLSLGNLIKEIEISENTEDMVTRLDVNGADGVDIRDVNPTGSNKIINLDYFMTQDNFDQDLIDKYWIWKRLVDEKKTSYYALSVQYSVLLMQRITEEAKLEDLNGELVSINNQRGVIIQAIAQGIQTQSSLDAINIAYADKENEINAKKSDISTISQNIDDIRDELVEIADLCNFETFFSENEYRALDKYIKDGDVSDSTFVSTEVSDYTDGGITHDLSNTVIVLSGSEISNIDGSGNDNIISVIGGTILVGDTLIVDAMSAVIDMKNDGKFILTANVSKGEVDGDPINGGSLSITGTYSNYTGSDEEVSVTVNGFMYYTLNSGEYRKRSVAWDLFEYGDTLLRRLSQPSYTFNISAANFFAIDEFNKFKNEIDLGQRVYVDNYGDVMTPICIGANIVLDKPDTLELKFSDSYVSSDKSFNLVDILEKSVSMSKTVDVGKFNYESFIDSGASSDILGFIKSALDVTKNAIMSSSDQAITWDGAGLRLRKKSGGSDDSFEDEQIWMSNNSIMMTDDSWETAKMAIGKFHDNKLGDLWGIVAPMIVGTIIAGESLVIESEKTDGSGVSVFRVDGDGCRMYNGDISVIGDNALLYRYTVSSNSGVNMIKKYNDSTVVGHLDKGTNITITSRVSYNGITYGEGTSDTGVSGYVDLSSSNVTLLSTSTGKMQVSMHHDYGFVIGKYPLYTESYSGKRTLNNDNATLWIDRAGNVHMKGILEGTVGKFTGDVMATTLHIGGKTAEEYVNAIAGEQIAIISESMTESIDEAKSTANSAMMLIESDAIISRVLASNNYKNDITTLETSIEQTESRVMVSIRDSQADLETYIRNDIEGVHIGRTDSVFETSVKDDGFYIGYYEENNRSQKPKDVGVFDAYGLDTNRIRLNIIQGASRPLEVMGTSTGGWAWV